MIMSIKLEITKNNLGQRIETELGGQLQVPSK